MLETSPMLNDISAMSDWAKVCTGLMRLFQGKYIALRYRMYYLY